MPADPLFPGSHVAPSFHTASPAHDDVLGARIASLAAWIGAVGARVRTTELATVDEAAAKELRRALEIVASHDPDREEKLGDRVAVLAERLDTLSPVLASTASVLAAKDGQIAGLQRRPDEQERRLELVTAGQPASGGDDRDDLRRAIAELAARVEAISQGVAWGRDLEELAARLRSSDERLGTVAEELQSRLEEIVSNAGATADARVESLDPRRLARPSALQAVAGTSGSGRRLAAVAPAREERGSSQAYHARVGGTSEPGAELHVAERRREAEATAHDTRAEFLTHLERLARRVEQQLGELRDPASAAPEDGRGAQVVALRAAERPSP